jgi:ABC-type transport system substrate-binding protein
VAATWDAADPVPDSLWPTDSPNREAEVKYPAHDKEKAQRCFDDFLQDTNLTELEIDLFTNAPAPLAKTLAETAAAQLSKIEGLTVNPRPIENAVYSGQLREGRYQIGMMVNPNPTITPTDFYRAFHSDGDLNITRYSNLEMDPILEDLVRAADEEARTDAFKRLARVWVEDPPVRYLSWEQDTIIGAQNLKGMHPVTLFSSPFELLWLDD